MALKTRTFGTLVAGRTKADTKKTQLLGRHHDAVQKVLAEAKTFSSDRQRALEKISDLALRKSAAR